ncbi:primary-amine oxidase [Parafrankia sp. BMG5.11]|uniref:primary-amine oxidase n=1 Tax=Parafrankia sp. BMG5.11 TaxID=222540 RepID=UPI001FB54739|nr:primary-amine oxidase [Parafrankia sp. BMG5.11]
MTVSASPEPGTIPARPAHPLEPLSAAEIGRATAILRASEKLGPEFRFVSVELNEPPKAAMVSREAERDVGEELAAPDRQAFCVLHERGARLTHEAVVSLSAGTVVEMYAVPGVQAAMMMEEFLACEDVVRADPDWQAAMRRRGVTDFSLAMIDPWSAGYTGREDDPARRRIARPVTFVRSGPGENGYARPAEGLQVVVDLEAMAVIDVTDHGQGPDGPVPLPPRPGNYAPALMTAAPENVPAFDRLRDDLRPIEVTQPRGASFTVDGYAVRWQKWDLRIGFTPREGLILHQVAYTDRGRRRPILQRASVSEMFVPYGDPAPTHRVKNVFDMGEYGVGVMANSLRLGCDCLGDIRYFDAVVNDSDGNPVAIPNAVCLHEEDTGIAWKHTDFRTGQVEVRRMRRLVISMICTVGNYEYGFFWYLYLDGSIEFEVKLTGVISTGAVRPGESPSHGVLVAPGLYGPHHQHFFNVRLDLELDGGPNSVHEIDSVPDPIGPDNPTGVAWRTQDTLLDSERHAQRRVDPSVARFWRITNPRVEGPLGRPVAYRLVPGHTAPLLAHPDSHQAARGRFASRNLWVTAHDERERYAAGRYPNQNAGNEGLPQYAAADRPVADTDIVVWYSFGAHHVVRPEDWPVMPVSRIGFELRPDGFFDGNPALDLPPAEHLAGHASGHLAGQAADPTAGHAAGCAGGQPGDHTADNAGGSSDEHVGGAADGPGRAV